MKRMGNVLLLFFLTLASVCKDTSKPSKQRLSRRRYALYDAHLSRITQPEPAGASRQPI